MPAPLDDWLNPTVQAALVAATVAVGGWVYNGRQNRRLANQIRAERVDDIQRAVLAEIRAHVVALENQQLSPEARQTSFTAMMKIALETAVKMAAESQK